MNELVVTKSINFNGKDIPIITGGFGNNNRIVTELQISLIHNMELKEVRKSLNRLIEKNRLRESIDFIDLKGGKEFPSYTIDLLISLGYSKSSLTQAKNIFILSERGYCKLIKSMDDDCSWDIMDSFVEEYFNMKKIISNIPSYQIVDEIERAKKWIEEQEEKKMLINKIKQDEPLVELAKKRLDKNGLLSITESNTAFNLKRGKITRWAKENGFLHKTKTEVNQAGQDYFRIYDSAGYRCVGVTEIGLNFINENIENIR